ncbi:MAG: hypothetical protein OXN97_01265 [Bryobacterales bacterium]|nr:hypothetical protein [Bryobacterales bacterium]
MTKVVIALFAVLSICVSAVQADEGVSSGTPLGGASDPDGGIHGFVNPAGLAGVLQLNEGQRMRLQSLQHEFDDEVFPLIRDSWEKEWELRRLGRSKDSDASKSDMLVQEVEMLYERIRGVGERHRERDRSVLSSQQISVLDKLEEALELTQAAKQAVCANLIATPDSREFGIESGFDSCVLGPGIPAMFGEHVKGDEDADAASFEPPNS